ncbi:acyl-CoA dehydrogenase family protein [Pseudomonas sp. CCC3.1]|uniref:acyl-CoA dehydrogenase family protein n=1 Tax=Pseudomonas sp. CCC3.1 TaxID=3048607 RepID=UPI002AC9EE60|nr:acyl-CoA dehydrogenase family protein [Pseudomonas sp. CCC3.1]MEB0205644.1 acyl-CoA dehydrogenase family protein [Pseudomonas sp. CCC3.1]WPX38283.1 acyl-CoA dehydrogenase family protein [Pseudomonas sp. CCC3.1]
MLDPVLSHWLEAEAEALDLGHSDPQTVLSQLAAANVLRVGVSPALGGSGGTVADALEVVANVASHSLASAFVFWGQRAFIEYVLQSPNTALRERLLPDLLSGQLAGATGLSNAMKFLSGVEGLQVRARAQANGWSLEGRLHWVTNLRKSGFVVAAAIEREEGGAPFVLAIPDALPGLKRSADLALMGLQSSNTAAIDLHAVQVDEAWLLHDNAKVFLPAVRPAFLGLQCAMAIGLARRSLKEAHAHLQGPRSGLLDLLHEQQAELEGHVTTLKAGLLDGRFLLDPAALFKIRIALADATASALQFELQASGGKAYLSAYGSAFARRWRESAFVPIVTPSLVQLRAELQRQTRVDAQ